MLKQAIAVLLFAPAIGWAECGFINAGGEMTIVVGKDNDKCFSSDAFREAFRSSLTASLKSMEDNAPPPRPARRRSAQRPSVMELPLQQAELYYGQDPKRSR